MRAWAFHWLTNRVSLRKAGRTRVRANRYFGCACLATLVGGWTDFAGAQAVVPAQVATAPLHQYEDAPATPDADDSATWIHPRHPERSLVIGTLKDGGLIVYDLRGRVVQTIAPPNLPTITPLDPPTPAGLNAAMPKPCAESDTGENFGRFNNVEIAYDIATTRDRRGNRSDIAVVTDRGCDRLRFYKIDANHPTAPLVDITDTDTPRVFHWRFVQPSPLQPTGMPQGLYDNPLDDQSTAYGLALWRRSADQLVAFVSQRSRSVLGQVEIFPTGSGKLSYRLVRAILFDVTFSLPAGQRRLAWTPCREEADVDPQAEGIVVDQQKSVLYVALETIGIYKLDLNRVHGPVVSVGRDRLIEPVKSFGQPYWALPDDGEFSCEYNPTGTPPQGVVVAEGAEKYAGANLEIDVEGLTIYYAGHGAGYLIASSQGSNTFHVFERQGENRHLGVFQVDGVADTDGIEVINVPLGGDFPLGLFVAHNGAAPEPANTDPINGFEYDGSTQFKFVRWDAIANAFSQPLRIDAQGYDPRDGEKQRGKR